MLTHTNSSPVMDMDWSADGDNTDVSNSSSPNVNRVIVNDPDSFSEDDDFSDEFSIPDSDDERRTEGRMAHHQIIQVKRNILYLVYTLVSISFLA